MKNFSSLFDADPKDWLTELPAHQQKTVAEFLSNGRTYDDIGFDWSSTTTAATSYFSADSPQKNLKVWEHVKIEVKRYICNDDTQKEVTEKAFGENSTARQYIIATISSFLGSHFGMTAVAISPLVVLALASVGRVTLNVWCAR